eukprot:scaffold231847_cov22-Tisochrysis_lutea.AAC.1
MTWSSPLGACGNDVQQHDIEHSSGCVWTYVSRGHGAVLRLLSSLLSLSVDMDESFALEAGHELVPPGMDVKNGMLHVNRHKATSEGMSRRQKSPAVVTRLIGAMTCAAGALLPHSALRSCKTVPVPYCHWCVAALTRMHRCWCIAVAGALLPQCCFTSCAGALLLCFKSSRPKHDATALPVARVPTQVQAYIPAEDLRMFYMRSCVNVQAQELKTRMRALLMGKQEDYVVEVKGPGQ